MERLRRALRTTTGGLPGQFWALWTATLINRAGGFIIIFLAVYLTTERGFTATAAGLVVGLYGVGGAIGVTIGGHLADHWGRKPTVLLSLGSAAILMVALGFAEEPPMIMLGAGVLGLTAEGARPALGAMIADIVPPADRMRAFSVYYWAINLGFASAAVLAGFASSAGYLALFIGDAATTAAAAILIALKTRETRPELAPDAPADRGRLATALRDRVFMGFVACNFLIAVVMLQHMSMLPIAMIDGDGLSERTFGYVIALNGIMIVAGQFFVTRLLRDRRASRVMALAGVVMGVGFGLTAFAHAPVWYAVTVLIWTAGEMINAPANSTLLAGLSPVSMRGRYQGLLGLSWQAASFVAPVLGGFVHERAGNTALWLGCLVVASAAGLWSLFAARARERRMEELTALVLAKA